MIILCSLSSFTSGRILRDILSEMRGEKVKLTAHPENLIRKKLFPNVRYGNSFGEFNKDTSLNSPEFIRLCSNKLTFSKYLEEKFYTPIYSRSTENLTDDLFPVLIRQNLSLSGGKGIILCKDRKSFNENWRNNYWTKYVYTDYELRVHVLGGNIIKIFRKEPMEEMELPIRNNQTCHFSIRNIEKYPKLTNLINDLEEYFKSSSLNYGFYALDIGWDSKSKKYFIFEANSAPGLNEHTATEYAEYINESLEVK